MKVLFIPYVTNAFFSTLFSGLERYTTIISDDVNLFWETPFAFDIVHIHFPEAFYLWDRVKKNPDPVISAKLFISRLSELKKMGVSIVWTVHNLAPHESLTPNLDKMVFNALIESACGIICQSKTAKETILKSYPQIAQKALITIPHINYIDCYPNDITVTSAREKLGLSKDTFLYLCLGQIRPYKNTSMIIKAFKKVSQLKPNVHLLIVGELARSLSKKNKLFLKFTSLLNAKIDYFPQYVADDALQVYLNAADVCVFAYSNIFMSGAIILAESFGVPIIAPNLGCLMDYVNRQNGFLFEAGQIDSLIDKMLKATESNLEELGKNAKAMQLKNDVNYIANETYQFYRDIS